MCNGSLGESFEAKPNQSRSVRPDGLRLIGSESSFAPRSRSTAVDDEGVADGTEIQDGLSEPPVIGPSPAGSAPLSFAQEQVWRRAQLSPGAPLDNKVLILERRGSLDRKALEQSCNEITRRHHTLRTTFPAVDRTPVQVIGSHEPVVLPLTELTSLPEDQRRAEVLRIASGEARKSFDLVHSPPIRAGLFRVSQNDYVLVITLHAMVADEWALNLLACELGVLYQSYSEGKPSPLPDLPLQYADYAHWQRGALQRGNLEEHFSYWRARLAGIPPVLELPTDRPRRLREGFRRNRQSLVFSKELSESVKALSEGEGVTLYTILLAAFEALLLRYTGQDDVVLGSIASGRDRVETRGLIGQFAQTAVIRADLQGDPTFRELLRRVADSARRDYQHQDLPFDRLLSELKRDARRHPLFRVLFSFASRVSPVQSGWQMADFEEDTGAAEADLQLQLYDNTEGMLANFIYDTDLFDAATIHRMSGHFQKLLEEGVADPSRRISELPLLTKSELHKVLVEFNDTMANYRRDLCVHNFFEAQVERTPNNTALVCENDRLTYRELNARANQVAHYLRKRGVGSEVLVGLCTERSVQMLIGILGILKAGGAYVPLDPAYPKHRLAGILEDAKAPIVLTQLSLLSGLPEHTGEVSCLDADWPKIAAESEDNPAGNVEPRNLGYVLFTSGSTGRSKGVAIEHHSAATFVQWAQDVFTPEELEGTLFSTSMCFDLSVFEMFVPLSVGGKVIMAQNAISLSEVPAAGEVTLINTVPSAIAELLKTKAIPESVRVINLAGEALPTSLAHQIYAKTRVQKIYNLYGPTEDTTYSTYTLVPRDAEVTIGRPISDTQAYILDIHKCPVPIGVPGELHLAGDGLARGYFGRPELTNERFLPSPFGGKPGARIYRTGDLARFLPDGNIQYLGRIDNQVKIRGFRIELGEVESVLRQHPRLNDAVVVAREDVPGDKRLVAYVVPMQGPAPTVNQLRSFLKEKLPHYMVPSRFVFLEALPLTPNGKLDRRALPAPEQLEPTPEEEFIAPRDAVESELVEIWKSVLKIRSLGVKQNFFELGGHSLLVAKLLRRIEQAFGKRLTMAAIFEAPTIELQASVLGKASALPRNSAIVSVQPGGSKAPFFCFGFNAGPVLLPLARRLGSDQPLLGVDPTLLQDCEVTLPISTESIATLLVKQIRELQPEGPYYLGGFCAGGLMAYETASQLMALGQQVALLALFEPQTPADYNGHSNGHRLHSLGQKLTFLVHNLPQLMVKEGRAYLQDRFDRLVNILDNLRPRRKSDTTRNLGDVLDFSVIYRDYQLKTYPGRVTLFQAADRPSERGWERECWRGLCTALEVHEIPGYWNWIAQFFLEPNVKILANKLNERLE